MIGGIFESAAAQRTEAWLRDAVLEGMAGVPPFDMSQIRAAKGNKKRTIVFTFGRSGAGESKLFYGFQYRCFGR